jgi:RHS repeat-associated protein
MIGLGYNEQGNMTQITPPGRPAHLFGSTAAGRPQSYEAPATGQGEGAARTTWGRDRDGLVTGGTYPDNATVSIELDDAGRPSVITLPRGQIVATYDPATGILTGITAPGGVALAFGHNGHILTDETWSGPVAGSVSATLDNDLWLTSRAINGNAVAYERDDDGIVTQAGALALTPDPATGLPSAATLGNVASTWGYNGFAEVTAIRAAFNNSTLYQVGYTRDQLGRVSQRVETIGGVSATYDFAYDVLGRLLEVRMNNAVVEAYTYDDNGNRLTATTVAGGVTATYDDRDRLIQQGGTTYGYTASGELRTKNVGGQTTTYTYDQRGSLLAVALPDGRTIEYVIDGQGRRIGKRVNSTLVQGFLYAGGQVVAELDGAGNVVSTFVYDDGLVPAYMQRGGTNYRLVTDQLGSVRLVVDASTGQVVQRIDYDTWGNVTVDTNPSFQPFGYAGGLTDRDTGLVRFGARDYDPQTGRWTAKDPILFAGGDTNLYGYVGNDPVNLIDPTGYKCMDVWDRTWDYFKTSNKVIPGALAPGLIPGVGLGTATGGAVAKTFGTLTVGQAGKIMLQTSARFGMAGATAVAPAVAGSVLATAAINFALVSAAFEGGLMLGSLIQAAIIDPIAWDVPPCNCP